MRSSGALLPLLGVVVALQLCVLIGKGTNAEPQRSSHLEGNYPTEPRPGYYIPPSPCDQSSCYPATGNLLIGREDKLSTSSTCGLYKPERFCIVSHLEDRKKCFTCDSRQDGQRSHHIKNVVSTPGRSRKTKWWQSVNGVEKVFIQLDLEAEFHFTHLIITFKTFRPAAMFIERSFDFGRTWRIYRYFAYDCAEAFPNIIKGPPQRITDVVCEERYSAVAPSTEGEVIFRVLPPSLHVEDPYSEEVQNLLKMTNLRINFTKLHTLGDDLLDQRSEIKEKYYYAIYDMVVRGSCSCYGHASRCLALPGVSPRPDMVHGMCECTHNTKGPNCEQCDEFHNDLPWRPAIGRSPNACKRCNCNNHATKCHFDPAVFEATGHVSGGVCDDCAHNTMGRNCEHCRPFFYKDPNRDFTDAYVCQPCDCDPRGSLDDGICDSLSSSEDSEEAGRCHCKRNVDGRRCDRCKNGFWNFSPQNPDGCEPCTCNALGTIDTQGCHQFTGECTCKRYVTGRDCNKCQPEHWGMSEDKDGCKPCDCDPGGSFDNNCEIGSGQCNCRPHVTGRRCDHTEQGFFAGLLDYLTYEAEITKGSSNIQVVVREPVGERETSWTGLGFVRAYEGSHIEFEIDNIRTGMEYDIVVRYEPQVSSRWEDVRVIVERPSGFIDRNGPCANAIPQDDRKQISLPSDGRHAIVYPPVCLEPGKRYKIRLEFSKYIRHQDTPSASVLIDSIVLMPRPDGIPFFKGPHPINIYRQEEFTRFRCGQSFYTVGKPSVSEVCKNHLFSIGIFTYGEGIDCSCDLTGSVSAICDPLGGQCQCKPNVVGRRCDRCAPGNYGFGPTGCRSCDCNSIGSLDNFCEVANGQCKCRPNTYGRQCDECQPGFWNYPSCRPCECNGHADTCDPRTGHCVDCRDYSGGPHCDRCEDGFYGDPRIGINIPCRPCPCPGTPESGHNFGQTCSLDRRTQNVICNCETGYAGERCDRCNNNFYGNPSVPGGRCQPCQCNNNVDVTRPGNCDPNTGQCLQCLFNTEGFNCELCKPGHWGDAINQLCKECVCDVLGTNFSAGYCDSINGQCPCLPNVEGLSCDTCKQNHWKIASGEGCEPCDCDPHGSYASQCNEFDGQCNCKREFGGRKCDQCRANYWGDPNVECFACQCNLAGSATQQCHQTNGTCICIKGVGGEKCDRCARGYTGQAPYCTPCGECFDNWDYIIGQLRDQTLGLLEEARKIKQSGVTGVYTEQFAEMEKKIDKVRAILAQANVTNADIEELQKYIDSIRQTLSDTNIDLRDIDDNLDNTTNRIFEANSQLDLLRNLANQLKKDAGYLKDEATALQEANVEGALNITRDAQKRSRGAQNKVDNAEHTLRESERERRRTESLMERASADYNRTFLDNEKALDEIEGKINALEYEIPDINNAVCDARGDPCDILCGGAKCGKCGGLSCSKGAVTKAANALNLTKQADEILKEKDAQATELLNKIIKARRDADEAKEEAQKAYDKALAAKNRSEDTSADVTDLLERLGQFLGMDKAKPSEIRQRTQEVLDLAISLQPEQIKALAKEIEGVIGSLTNIDDILRETAGDLADAQRLKDRADRAKKEAEAILDVAKKVAKALADAKDAQDKAREAIDKANQDIGATENDLAQIGSETTAAQDVANKSVDDVAKLKELFDNLKKKFTENEIDVRKAGQAANHAVVLAEHANKASGDLERKYGQVSKTLDAKARESGNARERAEKLRQRADELAQNATEKMRELKEMEDEFDQHEVRLRDLSAILDALTEQMNGHLKRIEEQATHYRQCQP